MTGRLLPEDPDLITMIGGGVLVGSLLGAMADIRRGERIGRASRQKEWGVLGGIVGLAGWFLRETIGA